MKTLKSLSSSRFRRMFLSVYALIALLPLLILIYYLYDYAYPQLAATCPSALDGIKETLSYILAAMVVVPLLGYTLIIGWIRDLESLTETVKARATELVEASGGEAPENEMVSLRRHFDGLYRELQDKIRQINDYSQSLIDSNIRLSEQAITDGLTGLYNRRHFDERLKEEVGRALRHGLNLALIMIDVDGFKKFNDRWGHPSGDALLREVGQVIRAQIRRSDVGFRYGGDEFAVILPQCGLDDAQTIAAKLVVAMSGRAVAMRLGKEGSVSLSCGVADLKVGPDRLVEAADQGLLLAKAQGKGRVEAGGKPG